MPNASNVAALIQRHARPLRDIADVSAIVDDIGDASLVLLGEATHGTDEFYRLRAAISQRLIEEKGFDAVAVEADWPDALQVSRYVAGDVRVRRLDEALGGFERFPRWMWRNEAVRDFVQWLRAHTAAKASPDRAVGFFGLDLYSLRDSMHAVIDYLDGIDPAFAEEARKRYDCFDSLATDPQRYGYAARYGAIDGCEREAVRQLREMLSRSAELLQHDGPQSGDELFYAQQNARVVRDAERYYRSMFQADSSSWNLRDTHMADTLEALRRHLAARHGRPAKIVVWAHNSHVGDARATEPGEEGQLNLGQLVRQRATALGETFLLGFTTHSGTVTAAPDWDEPAHPRRVVPSHADSVERLLHDAALGIAYVPLRRELREAMSEDRLQRAIGVIYRPDTERVSHYFGARLAEQFDGVVHVDDTHAVVPLDAPTRWQRSSAEETYPSGL
jgi:erythromycin esterase-like protein